MFAFGGFVGCWVMGRVKGWQNQKVFPSQLKSLAFQASLPRCALGSERLFDSSTPLLLVICSQQEN